jgi:drug/metabolite transporter (DMT)-like permease
MTPPHLSARQGIGPASQLVPILCLIGVVVLLSSITPAIKYVFQQGALDFLSLAVGRVFIGFLGLAIITSRIDPTGLRSLCARDLLMLAPAGLTGVASYAVAAWGLMYTNVTHYVLLYSLLPTFTTLFSIYLRKDRAHPVTCLGIGLSWAGCVYAISDGIGPDGLSMGIGEGLALLFTILMSTHIVLSATVVKRFGLMTSNTAMFGMSAVLLCTGNLAWGGLPHQELLSLSIILSVLFIGLATAGVFILRSHALQFLTPATVGAYHNLIPVCTIGLAHLLLGEPVSPQTILGGAAVMLGTELVRRAPRLGTFTACLTKGVKACAAPVLAPPLTPYGSTQNDFAGKQEGERGNLLDPLCSLTASPSACAPGNQPFLPPESGGSLSRDC